MLKIDMLKIDKYVKIEKKYLQLKQTQNPCQTIRTMVILNVLAYH